MRVPQRGLSAILFTCIGVMVMGDTLAAAAPDTLDVEVLEMRTPLYPKAAFEAGLQGEVTLEFVITAEGQVQDVRVSAEDAESPFAGQAAEALRAWRYKPVWDASRCLPSRVSARQTFEFLLQDGEPTVATQPTEFGPVPEPGSTGNLLGLPNSDRTVPVHREAPRFPRAALLNGVSGTVIMGFAIEPDGSVSDVTVTHSKPEKMFDREALRALERWRFEPVRVDGQVTRVWACQRLDFKINP